ncbi:MAG: hypothetical protein ACR2J7_00895 [Luteimonas sp.]
MTSFRRTSFRLWPLACLLLAGGAFAQSTGNCPSMAANNGMAWEKLDGPGFTYCKAIRSEDGSQAFAVMIGRESPFRPRRGDRAEQAVIDGHGVHWYRGEIAADPDAIVRETLIKLGRNHVAHVTLRADSEEQKAATMRQVEALRFQAALLSSN